jgi:hypothetical protein
MVKEYLPEQSKTELLQMLDAGQVTEVFDALATPLHEALYKKQTFDFLDELPTVQQVILAFDYIQNQVGQGGFIQLIQNNYISLVLTVIEGLQEMKTGDDMIRVLDDVLKVYVLNQEALDREMSVEEFSKLYEEFKEFEAFDQEFLRIADAAKVLIIKKYFS